MPLLNFKYRLSISTTFIKHWREQKHSRALNRLHHVYYVCDIENDKKSNAW